MRTPKRITCVIGTVCTIAKGGVAIIVLVVRFVIIELTILIIVNIVTDIAKGACCVLACNITFGKVIGGQITACYKK